MSKENTSKKMIGVGVLSAIAASLCCITPVLAFVAGSAGLAANFSWLEPGRPYLVGVAIIALGFAWWQKLQPGKGVQVDCACENDDLSRVEGRGKPSFWQSRKFLGIVTVFAAFMLAFPYYAHVFYPATGSNTILVESENVQQVDFAISGMTCTGCEAHIEHAVSEIPGFIDAVANHKEGTASVRFDRSKSTVEDLIIAIDQTGYTVTDYTTQE